MANDLHFQLIDPTLQSTGSNLRFSFVPPTIAVNGIQKLMNRWLKKFLTIKGSNPGDLTDGTNFGLLIGGNISDVDDLQAQILTFIDDCNTQIQTIDRTSPQLTSDERLRSADLLIFNVLDATSIEFWVQVTSTSGKRATALIPYATST
jgi:hypothetical protein